MSNNSNTTRFDIYGIGAALVDTEIAVSVKDLDALAVEKGVMTLVDEARQLELITKLGQTLEQAELASGGSAANTIIAASYFGANCFYSCRVSDDENGTFYLNDLSRGGVSYPKSATKPGGITGKCLVMITPDAERSMNTFLGISETIDDSAIDEGALKQSHYAYIEGYLVTSQSGKPAAIRLKELAKTHQVKVALSLSDPAIVEYFHDGLSEIIGDGVDLLFCNEAEAMAFTKTSNVNDAFDALKTISKTFVITLGSQGALLFDGKQRIQVEAPEVQAIDTNGAGDMFAGAFMSALKKDPSFEKAGTFACKAAAKIVSQFGPRLKPEQYSEIK